MRKLKENGTSETELKSAIDELLRLKQELSHKDSDSTGDVSFNFQCIFKMSAIIMKFFTSGIVHRSNKVRYSGAKAIHLQSEL